jgi:hypothetical protein
VAASKKHPHGFKKSGITPPVFSLFAISVIRLLYSRSWITAFPLRTIPEIIASIVFYPPEKNRHPAEICPIQ